MSNAALYLHNVRVGPALVRLVVLGVFQQNLVHVCACVLEELIGAVEDNEGYLTVTQHTQLIGLLHQAKLPLCNGNLGDKDEQKSGCVG